MNNKNIIIKVQIRSFLILNVAVKSERSRLKDLKDKIRREDVEFHYFSYLVILFTIYLSSFFFPAIIFMDYVLFFFLPNFLEASNFISLFTDINSLISLITMPLVIIGCYLLRLLFMALITRLFWRYTEKKSPSKDGIIPRNFPSRALKFYHMRSFMIKYPKNVFVKGLFPWLVNFLYNTVGSNRIGKGSTIEESVGNDKFSIIGKNVYIGVNSTLASHLVEGIFGNIAYFQIHVGDNVTAAGTNQIGPGTEIHDNSYLLPTACASKHNVLKGNNYYFGIPLRKIFTKKVSKYLGLTPEDLDKNENLSNHINKNKEKKPKTQNIQNETFKKKERNKNREQENNDPLFDINKLTKEDLAVDFTTCSSISRVNIKFLAVYLPIIWLNGLIIGIVFYTYTFFVTNWFLMVFFLPVILLIIWFVFILGCFLLSKLFFILINLIHQPKEGIFLAEIGDTDFEFWKLRTELRKLVLWLMRNSPIPWMDALAFRWFGIKMDFSSALYDSWCDGEFVSFGRKVLVGQGATVMSSMVVGKYLIIKRVIFDDYALVGGHTTIAPGTIVGKDTVVAAISTTLYDQVLEPKWIYIGIPVIKLKPNKYAESRRDIITKKHVDDEKKFEMHHEVNIDEDKKEFA